MCLTEHCCLVYIHYTWTKVTNPLILIRETMAVCCKSHNKHMHAYLHTYIHTHTHTYIHAYIIHTYTYIHTHTHIHTYIHTYIHSGHGKTRAYLHRFKLLKSATCPCNNGDRTTDHLIYHCTLLQQQRGKTREGYISTWNLANKQTRTNNQMFKIIYEILELSRLWQTVVVKV